MALAKDAIGVAMMPRTICLALLSFFLPFWHLIPHPVAGFHLNGLGFTPQLR